jgi:hypothetical protein
MLTPCSSRDIATLFADEREGSVQSPTAGERDHRGAKPMQLASGIATCDFR